MDKKQKGRTYPGKGKCAQTVGKYQPLLRVVLH